MKRRHFVAGILGSLAGQAFPAHSQEPASNQPSGSRAAIVIGVDKCVGLELLDGASQGAKDVAAWLQLEKYDVRTFNDDHGQKPVRVSDIVDAVDEIVSAGNIQQLVIYFAGHGFITPSDDVWLLSKAPRDGGETISLNSTYRAAKNSGIPNIALISDACRSVPATSAQLQITPRSIFPNDSGRGSAGKVDRFYATQLGMAANEFEIEKEYQGVFTATLLRTFKTPDDGLAVKLDNGERVVPNRKLGPYLEHEVPILAQSKSFKLKQFPECDVPSGDEVYIAHVSGLAMHTLNPPPPAPPPAPTVNDVNTAEFGKIIRNIGSTDGGGINTFSKVAIDETAARIGFHVAKDDVQASYQSSTLWRKNAGGAGSGFVISGSSVAEIAVSHGIVATLKPLDQNGIITLAFNNNASGCNVAIRFANGTGTVLAGLRNHVGTVSTSDQAITNVSYDANYEVGQAEPMLQRLRATSAAAFQSGVLRFSGTQSVRQRQAEFFGDSVRMGKSADPTLGIYAAYAYDEASLPEKVKSVNGYMRGDLQVELFDVAMLAGEAFNGVEGKPKVVPCCPMLNVGWSFLPSSRVKLWPTVAEAQAFLIPSPWTLFKKEGMDILMPAIASGKLG